MALQKHVDILKQGVDTWNEWRRHNTDEKPDLFDLDLSGADLDNFNLSNSNLFCAKLRETSLRNVDLSHAELTKADLFKADLTSANLEHASLTYAHLFQANCTKANLKNAKLLIADVSFCQFDEADLTSASLFCSRAFQTSFANANLTDCDVYGLSAWEVNLDGAIQDKLRIAKRGEPVITVDNLEIAQFIYLLINNKKIRDLIDTVTSKSVLILGRFTPKRKAVLDAIFDEIRKQDKVPILFDFEPAENQNFTDTVTMLARMSNFIIADLTDPSSVLHELAFIVPTLSTVAIKPIFEVGYEVIDGEAHKKRVYSMFNDFRNYPWVLSIYEYNNKQELVELLAEEVIKPAESKSKELRK